MTNNENHSPITKSDYLQHPVNHIDITEFDTRDIIEKMGKMSFTAREISRASEILNKMLCDKDCTVILTIAGSTSSAGCMKIYSDMVKYNMVDAIVASGATIVDMDFFEALGFRHYQGDKNIDDKELRNNYIDRIYDTYIDEVELQTCDQVICDIANGLNPGPYSSREFIHEMGRWLHNRKSGNKDNNSLKNESLVQVAFEKNVPIFCPAFVDSCAGFGLVLHREKNGMRSVSIDSVKDFRELTQIKIESVSSGLFMIGGGVPKNFAQDTVICAELLSYDVPMHKYAVQITVADPRDGACSGSTLKEACSWGKVDTQFEQMVFAEATSVLPLIISDAFHRGHWRKRKRSNFSKLFIQ